jgi:transketolase
LSRIDRNVRLTPQLLLDAKLRLLRMHYEARVGHVGGNLSCLEILMVLHHDVLGPTDHFILSKGHAAGALYVTLWSAGLLTDEDLLTFHGENTRLPGHPPVSGIPQIEFPTGSLGHGLSIAAGLALGKRLQGEPGRVYCLTSDGEWNEGSAWEALIFARQQELDNLVVLVDCNGLQGFGRTEDIANIGRLAEKFCSFGFDATDVNGHDPQEILESCSRAASGRPCAVIAHTTKGHGVSFMEDRFEWHYLPLSEEQYQQAVHDLHRSCAIFSAAP